MLLLCDSADEVVDGGVCFACVVFLWFGMW